MSYSMKNKMQIAQEEIRISKDVLRLYQNKKEEMNEQKAQIKANNGNVQSWRMRMKYFKGSAAEFSDFKKLYDEMRFKDMQDINIKTQQDKESALELLQSKKAKAKEALLVLPESSYKDNDKAQMEQNLENYIKQIDRRIAEIEDFKPVELTDEDRKALKGYNEVVNNPMLGTMLEIDSDAARDNAITELEELRDKIQITIGLVNEAPNIQNKTELNETLRATVSQVNENIGLLDDYEEYVESQRDVELSKILNSINE